MSNKQFLKVKGFLRKSSLNIMEQIKNLFEKLAISTQVKGLFNNEGIDVLNYSDSDCSFKEYFDSVYLETYNKHVGSGNTCDNTDLRDLCFNVAIRLHLKNISPLDAIVYSVKYYNGKYQEVDVDKVVAEILKSHLA